MDLLNKKSKNYAVLETVVCDCSMGLGVWVRWVGVWLREACKAVNRLTLWRYLIAELIYHLVKQLPSERGFQILAHTHTLTHPYTYTDPPMHIH